MNKKNTNKLLKDFPNLYKQYYLSPQNTCMCWGFECDDGWFELIYKLSEEIVKVNPACEVVQVKEKFGALRFYTDYHSDDTWKLIYEAESESLKICEKCGKEGKIRNCGWFKTLCEKHYKEVLKCQEEDLKKLSRKLKKKK